MILISSIVFGIYFVIMILIIIGFRKVSIFSSENPIPTTRFSIIIPFRNEQENLLPLLKTIESLNYPKELYEVIFINDDSTDSSGEIIKKRIEENKTNFSLLQNQHFSSSPKKDAIELGVKHSKFKWILTSDADCALPEEWLYILDAFIKEKNPVMIAAPVFYQSNDSFLENFQQLDGLSLQAITIGGFGYGTPLLCNGANMAYTKDAFYKVDGFTGNNHIASGDDVFILEKMKKRFPNQVMFLKAKQAIVSTKPQINWESVINQRIRWASKTSKQKNISSILLGISVFSINFLILAIPFLILFSPKHWMFYTGLFFLKILSDYLVLNLTAKFFETKIKLKSLLPQIFVYAVVIVLVVLGSFKKTYYWNGRKFSESR